MTDKEALLERGIELAQARETEEARAIFAALAADPDCSSFHLDVYSPRRRFFRSFCCQTRMSVAASQSDPCV
jgi:hypothetical protein